MARARSFAFVAVLVLAVLGASAQEEAPGDTGFNAGLAVVNQVRRLQRPLDHA